MGERGGRGRPTQEVRDAGRTTRSRAVVVTALRLFAERGYEATTMDDIAVAAGVSRSTLFRHFGSKDDILFSDQEQLLESVRRHLRASSGEDPRAAVCAAARMVFHGYVSDPDVALPRYRLVRANAALRDREIAMSARYQALFTQHLSHGHSDARRLLAAEALAAAVIAAHNHVLRSWLKNPGQDLPAGRLDEALAFVTEEMGRGLAEAGRPDPPRRDSTVLVAVYPADAPSGDVLARIHTALEAPGE
ncbi:AcrR family transcriptional regulator [Spinactinospora alkalitolerans]|uniref:AcrR family transcriptional regulator n=1 Tax=Spinactinospora alkalitolerans TaxID=687207 RepID=A0A852TUH7_9ACTN|nr:TetR/AcrR family transcriptional regulator [Spinactinospora alkalitolerans]NYE48096.1 AcrR family transcriptional regulator [Spinactinospora alkalitolerans]